MGLHLFCNYELFLYVATVAVALGVESPLTVVANATKLASIDIVHGDRDGPLLHLREHPLVVTVFALIAGFLVNGAVKGHFAHGAFVEFDSLLIADGKNDAGAGE